MERALTELDETTEPVLVALLLRQRFAFRKDLGLSRAEADLRRALALVPEEVSPSARTEILLAASYCGIWTEEAEYRAWGNDALRLARQLGDRDAETQALANLAMLIAGPGQAAGSDSEPFRLLRLRLKLLPLDGPSGLSIEDPRQHECSEQRRVRRFCRTPAVSALEPTGREIT